jgi:hypothetical protein
LEAEEMAALRPADGEWQALRAQWGELHEGDNNEKREIITP